MEIRGVRVVVSEDADTETACRVRPRTARIMLSLAQGRDVYIICGRTDLSRGIDGLTPIVRHTYELDPCENLYLFCGRRADRIKAVYCDNDRGFVLIYSRLENGHYQWPRGVQEARRISAEEYRRLLEGLPAEEKSTTNKVGSSKMNRQHGS